jgi:DNA-binding PadR family transcriptional regulator
MPRKSQSPTNAELAVLSLLAEQPMHGYQIEQTIEARGLREWTEIGFSSIYYILEKLRARGCVESRLKPAKGKGPAHQTFSLTPAGHEVFREAALNAIRNPHRSYNNLHLGLSNLLIFENTEVLEALDHNARNLRSRREHIQKKLASYSGDLPFQASAIFDLSLKQISCELEWVEDLVSKLKTKRDAL